MEVFVRRVSEVTVRSFLGVCFRIKGFFGANLNCKIASGVNVKVRVDRLGCELDVPIKECSIGGGCEGVRAWIR